MDQQELLELIGVSKIVLLLVCRGISIVKGIKITVSFLEDLLQIKELKRGGVIWEKIVFNGGWTISKISVTKAYLMTVMYFILNAWDFAFMELFKMNCPSSWHFGTTIAYGTLKTVSHPVEYLIVYTTIVVRTIIYQRTTKYDRYNSKVIYKIFQHLWLQRRVFWIGNDNYSKTKFEYAQNCFWSWNFIHNYSQWNF